MNEEAISPLAAVVLITFDEMNPLPRLALPVPLWLSMD